MPSQDTSTGYAQLFQENHFKCKSRSDKMIHFWLQSASDREAGQFAVRPSFLSEKKWCTLNLKPHKICVVSELQITSHRLQFLKVMFRYFLLNKWQYLFHFHSPFNNRTEAKKKEKKGFGWNCLTVFLWKKKLWKVYNDPFDSGEREQPIFHCFGKEDENFLIYSHARRSWREGHPFIMFISEDPWHSHLLPRV